MSAVEWVSVESRLPDDEQTVLIALDDGEVWTGFVEADQWFFVSGDPISRSNVEHWATFPEPPAKTLNPCYGVVP